MLPGIHFEQGWEYSITHSDRLTNTAGIPQISSIWRTKYADGSTDWDAIERMGREGWELVSAFPVDGNGTTLYVTFIFRRPARPAPPPVAAPAPEPPPAPGRPAAWLPCPPPSEAPRRRLTAWQAVLAGQIVVNLPVLLLFYGVYQLAGPVLPANQLGYWLRLIAAFAASMAWGVYASRRWQRWAVRRGVKEVDLQRLAGMTLLMMPRSTPREPPAPPRKPKPK